AAAARWCSTVSRGRSSSCPTRCWPCRSRPAPSPSYPRVLAASTPPVPRPLARSRWHPGWGWPAWRAPASRWRGCSSPPSARQLAIALAAFAPGLAGYGLTANLSRVLYADGRSRASALAVSGGWLLVIVADLLILPFAPRSAVVPWLGVGTTLGLTCSSVALLILVRRFRGPEALRGWTRAALAGLAGALAGAAAGLGVSAGVQVSGFLPNVAVTLLASAAVVAAFLAVVAVADGGDLRAALSASRGGDPPRPPPGLGGD